jgi:hypothetical protein
MLQCPIWVLWANGISTGLCIASICLKIESWEDCDPLVFLRWHTPILPVEQNDIQNIYLVSGISKLPRAFARWAAIRNDNYLTATEIQFFFAPTLAFLSDTCLAETEKACSRFKLEQLMLFFFHPLFFFFKCRLSIRSSAVGLQRSSWLDGKESCEINLSSPSPLDYCLAFSNGTVIWEFLVANSRFIFHGFVMYSLVVGDMYHGPWLSSQ